MKYIKDGKEVIDPRFKIKLKNFWGEVEDADAIPRSSDGQLLFLMEMVDKMKTLNISPAGSRIASVHNGSSLFTGDAGSGESNIRRFIIENDLLEAIIQLPNNLFYNTGITTYIWLLSNNKKPHRMGKVQIIDASQLYRKLRKNLGNKNCEFAPEHVDEILQVYGEMTAIERDGETGVASKIFDNSDFGFYKVTIERPKRLKALFSEERIAQLRFDKSLREPMEWAWNEFGDRIYSDLKDLEKDILSWCEDQDLNLSSKQKKALLSIKNWKLLRSTLKVATELMHSIGTGEYDDFNEFRKLVDKGLKASSESISASQKKAILDAVSWYDADAVKVVKSVKKLKGDKLDALLHRYNCGIDDLPYYGYFSNGNNDEFIEYETESDLRDYENVPLKDDIQEYFLREVIPHVEEAWINLDATKIGYEISFNKYFYKHKPLRSIEEVSQDILKLEEESEGLIREIVNLA